jgi:two-component system sensor histidine kinase UhpB
LLAVAAAQLALGSEILTARHGAMGGPPESDGERHRALKELTTRLTDRVEAERRRISRELHDQAGQSLTAILIRLDLITEQIADPKILQQIEQTEVLAQQTLDELRRLARDLRPAVLDDLGLEEALRILVASFSGGGLSITLGVDKPFPRLPGAIETALYRITQEALNNVVKHAQATVAAIRLHYEPQRVHLEIKDNGKGFDTAAGDGREGIGLVGMSERTDSLGGRLKVESRPGSGTRVKVEIPL